MARPKVRRVWIACLALALSLAPSAVGAEGAPPGLGPPEAQIGSKITVHYIDVDQGAAALVELPAPCGAVLIDAGGFGKPAADHLIAYLQAFFARRPDLQKRIAAAYITHSHLDHNTSLPKIVQAFTVSRYIETGRSNGRVTDWMNKRLGQSPTIQHVVVTEASVEGAGSRGLSNAKVDPLACADINPRIRLLSGARVPGNGLTAGVLKTENNHSITIRIEYGTSSFLWTGDMQTEALKLLVDRYSTNGMLDAQVYEAGHHGAENGTTQELVDAVTPDLAVIPVGHRGNSGSKTAYGYGHPRIEALKLLEKAIAATRIPIQGFDATAETKLEDHTESKAIYATGWDGDIVVTADAYGHLAVTLPPQ
jgi:beta-lactamase superfamily II metal-dependent hydrolase